MDRLDSISEAARMLFVSQSVVRRHIAKLKEFLNSKLLYRSKHGVTTTGKGQRFIGQINNSLSQILDATVSVRAIQVGLNIVKVTSLCLVLR